MKKRRHNKEAYIRMDETAEGNPARTIEGNKERGEDVRPS